MSISAWKIAGVSLPGFGHLAQGIPCQDAHEIRIAGSWFIGVVADGAGTAKFSNAGAAIACRTLAADLAERLATVSLEEETVDTTSIRSWIEEGLSRARAHLQAAALADEARLADFHATVLGAVAGAHGGVLFHIGDGAAMALDASGNAEPIISPPENSEYPEITFFLTQDNWREHLRCTPFGAGHDVLLLMTDGVTPLALSGAAPFDGFVTPLMRYLEAVNREEGEAALSASLSKDKVRRITQDDKTLVWALRSAAHD